MTRRLDCPGCASPMVAGDFGGIELDTCGSCRALWLDGGEWLRVFGRELGAVPAEAARRLACPACAAAGRAIVLEVVAVEGPAGIEVDRCPGCGGAFLDAGEMQELRRSAQPARAPREARSSQSRATSPANPGPETAGGAGWAALAASVTAGLAAAATKLFARGDTAPTLPIGTTRPPAAPTQPAARSESEGAGEAPGEVEAEPTREADADRATTLQFHCAQCGGPIDALPDDLVLDCPFCGSWSRLLRARVADACVVDCPPLTEADLAASWIERRVAVRVAEFLAAAETRGEDAGRILARELAERQAQAVGARERERLRRSVSVGERRLLYVPYVHEHADGFQLVLGRDPGGDKRMAVVGFVAEATEPAYDRRRFDFRDRGLRLRRGRLRMLSAKDMAEGLEGLPIGDPAGVARFRLGRERVKPQQGRLSELARVGHLHGRRTELVYKPLWIAEIREGSTTEWNLIDGQSGIVAGAVHRAQELQALLQPPGDSPFLPEWEAKAILVPHRCPECGRDLEVDRQAWFLPCSTCHVGIARTEGGLSRLRYSHVEAKAHRADWFPVWRFRLRSPTGHEELRALRAALGGNPLETDPEQPFAWVPARRLLGGLPGDRAFQRLSVHAHHASWEVVDEPLPPVAQGRILAASFPAEQAEALAQAAIAASLTPRELARANAASIRRELFAGGWSFSEARLVLLPGSLLPNGGFQLEHCNWPIPARLGSG